MREKLRVGAGWGFCLILMVSAGCSGRVLELSNTSPNKPTEDQQIRYIDVKNPSVARAVEAADRAETAKFVQIEIVEAQNPKRYAATFRVEYQPTGGEKIFLGAFSLYPPDNPATFIVPTHGKVRSKGTIVISLIIPKNYQQDDVLKVRVGKVEFVDSKDR